MNKQPEALRLAEHLELNATHQRGDDRHLAAAELRRLHELHELYQDKVRHLQAEIRRLHEENVYLRDAAFVAAAAQAIRARG